MRTERGGVREEWMCRRSGHVWSTWLELGLYPLRRRRYLCGCVFVIQRLNPSRLCVWIFVSYPPPLSPGPPFVLLPLISSYSSAAVPSLCSSRQEFSVRACAASAVTRCSSDKLDLCTPVMGDTSIYGHSLYTVSTALSYQTVDVSSE